MERGYHKLMLLIVLMCFTVSSKDFTNSLNPKIQYQVDLLQVGNGLQLLQKIFLDLSSLMRGKLLLIR